MTVSETPGGSDTPGGPEQQCDAERDGPWECESGRLAGWEVELPTKQSRSFSSTRESLALTSLPRGLARVMGEAEYQEQVVAIQELIDALSARLSRRKRWLWLLLAMTALLDVISTISLVVAYLG